MQSELLNWKSNINFINFTDTGLGVMEVSHRSKEYDIFNLQAV